MLEKNWNEHAVQNLAEKMCKKEPCEFNVNCLWSVWAVRISNVRILKFRSNRQKILHVFLTECIKTDLFH